LTISPSSPASTLARSARTSGWNRKQWATISQALEPRAAATIASASARVRAIGFSTSTCLPASRKATACSAWRALGVPITAASTSGSAASSRQSVVVRGIAWRSASLASDASRQLAAATSSAPGCARTARAW
jgi:hypothetical protein